MTVKKASVASDLRSLYEIAWPWGYPFGDGFADPACLPPPDAGA